MPPVLAVLATWIVIAGWVMLLGAFAGSLARPRVGAVAALRVSLWFGFSLLVLLALVPNFFVPLVGNAELWILSVATVLAAAAWFVVRWLRRSVSPSVAGWARPGWWVTVPIVALVLWLLVIAHDFAGPVTNYDSGLYHLNAIQYAAHYPTIPGLANLQDRLGTNVSSFNLAALLANTPWGIEAFRILVGLFAFLVATDVSLRLLDARRQWARQPGLYVLLLSLMLCAPFLAANPGYWVTSPSADTTAMFMTIVAGAYVADGIASRSTTWAVVGLLTAVTAASIRTQLWVFAGLVTVALLVGWWRARPAGQGRRRPRVLTLVGAGLSLVLLVTMMVRDALLSGWLLFPAAYLPVPVSWRVPDTTAVREWLLSWARDPGAAPEKALNGWYWLWPWVGRTLDDWAIRGALGLLALALVTMLVLRQARPNHDSGSARGDWGWLLAVAPALGTLAVWFWTAPDPRFAWGPILLTGAIPAAFALVVLARRASRPSAARTLRTPLPVLLTAGFMVVAVLPVGIAGLAQIRGFIAEGPEFRTYSFGPINVVASVNTVPTPATREFILPSGQKVLMPAEGDQCWMAFPLCRPYEDANLRFRGVDIADGFTSALAGTSQ